jgi:hypothetical protein
MQNLSRLIRYAGVIATLAVTGCLPDEPTTTSEVTDSPMLSTTSSNARTANPILQRMNARLAARGANYRVGMAEFLTDASSGQSGQTIFAFDRGNRKWIFHWVAGDPRRGGRSNVTYLVDQSDGADGALTNAETEPAIDRALDTWNNVQCSTIPIVKVTDTGADPDIFDALAGFGPLPGPGFPYSDIVHAGFLPSGFFDALFPPDGGDFALAVTITAFFVDGNNNPTDIDNDHRIDTAFREIYYNNSFPFAINANIDVETVALHESGHGLSQLHFGQILITNANGKLHFSPRALMNASYAGVLQRLLGTDKGGHCNTWAHWPN